MSYDLNDRSKSNPAQRAAPGYFYLRRRALGLGVAGLAGRSRGVRIWEVAGAPTTLFLKVRRDLLLGRGR